MPLPLPFPFWGRPGLGGGGLGVFFAALSLTGGDLDVSGSTAQLSICRFLPPPPPARVGFAPFFPFPRAPFSPSSPLCSPSPSFSSSSCLFACLLSLFSPLPVLSFPLSLSLPVSLSLSLSLSLFPLCLSLSLFSLLFSLSLSVSLGSLSLSPSLSLSLFLASVLRVQNCDCMAYQSFKLRG